MLLTTTGAKSGQQRLNPLAYLTIDGKMLIIGSYAGADVDPAGAQPGQPRAHVEVGTDSYDVTARELPRAERDTAWEKITAAASGFADYCEEHQPRHPAVRARAGLTARAAPITPVPYRRNALARRRSGPGSAGGEHHVDHRQGGVGVATRADMLGGDAAAASAAA